MGVICGIDIGIKGGLSYIVPDNIIDNGNRAFTYGFVDSKFPIDLTLFPVPTYVFIEEPLVFSSKATQAIASLNKSYGYWVGIFTGLAFGLQQNPPAFILTPVLTRKKKKDTSPIMGWKNWWGLPKTSTKEMNYEKLKSSTYWESLKMNEVMFSRVSSKTGKTLDGINDGCVDSLMIAVFGRYGWMKDDNTI